MSARASRRQVLAHIALADAPTPEKVDFNACGDHTTIGLEFERIADARPWLGIFGAALGEPHENDRMRRDGRPYRALTAYPRGEWRGWKVYLNATEDIALPVEPLDEATREQLQVIADSSAAHHQVAGSGGAPGQCSAECSCGVVFDGFDTIAAADALLDDHIAAATKAGAPC